MNYLVDRIEGLKTLYSDYEKQRIEELEKTHILEVIKARIEELEEVQKQLNN